MRFQLAFSLSSRKWFAQLRIRQLVGKRASSNIHCGSPDYEAVQSKGVTSLTLGSNARRRVHQNKKYKTLGSLALATALMASLLPTMALSQVYLVRISLRIIWVYYIRTIACHSC